MTRGWAPTAPPDPAGGRRVSRRRDGTFQPGPRPWDQAKRWLAHQLPGVGSAAADGGSGEVPAELLAESVRRHGAVADADQTAGQMRALADELTGLGPLAPIARRPGITDLLVDGTGAVWSDGTDGLTREPLVLTGDQVRQLAVRLLTQGGRRLDAAQPFADAQIGGARVHAVLPPVAEGGTQLSIRLPAARTVRLEELSAEWPHAQAWLEVLRHLVDTRANVLISGATGSGKTTLLTAVLAEAGPAERILTVEDTRELRPDHPHVVALQARPANAEGAGEITLSDLVRQALRMRPDRLVVGECRGAEVADFLAAMNTGHRGAWGTLHANSAQDVPARLAAMGALAGLSPQALALQAVSAVDAVVHVERTATGRRPVALALVGTPPDGARDRLELTPVMHDDGRQLSWGPGRALWGAGSGGGRHVARD